MTDDAQSSRERNLPAIPVPRGWIARWLWRRVDKGIEAHIQAATAAQVERYRKTVLEDLEAYKLELDEELERFKSELREQLEQGRAPSASAPKTTPAPKPALTVEEKQWALVERLQRTVSSCLTTLQELQGRLSMGGLSRADRDRLSRESIDLQSMWFEVNLLLSPPAKRAYRGFQEDVAAVGIAAADPVKPSVAEPDAADDSPDADLPSVESVEAEAAADVERAAEAKAKAETELVEAVQASRQVTTPAEAKSAMSARKAAEAAVTAAAKAHAEAKAAATKAVAEAKAARAVRPLVARPKPQPKTDDVAPQPTDDERKARLTEALTKARDSAASLAEVLAGDLVKGGKKKR
jgi:hypothetical protein